MSKINIMYEENQSKYLELMAECAVVEQEIENAKKEFEKKVKHRSYVESKIKSLLPKGYWFTYDVDTSWQHPKKYSIKNVSCDGNKIYVTVKEVFKKKPWPTFTGESVYRLEEFAKLSIYKTTEEATDGYLHRICPKCRGFMGYSRRTWCNKCMNHRDIVKKDFRTAHSYYDPKTNQHYHVEYEDELTRPSDRGFEGQSFTIRRLDTGEVIYTRNLWSDGFGENKNNLPEIEFIKECQSDQHKGTELSTYVSDLWA